MHLTALPNLPRSTSVGRLASRRSAALRGWRSRLAAIATLSVASMGVASGVAQADAAYNYVQPFHNYALQNPVENEVDATVTSIQPASGPLGWQRGIASYSDGLLSATTSGLGSVGYANQLFSDRLYSTGAPFSALSPDQLGVQIAVNDAAKTASVTLIAHSWGDTRNVLRKLRVEDGVLVGDGTSVGFQTNAALFAISLGRVVVPG